MDSLDNDPVLSVDADPLRLLRGSVWEEDHAAPRSGALHPRVDPGDRGQVCCCSVRGTHVLWPGLWNCLHSCSNVHRRNRYQSSSRRSLYTHHVNE